MSSCKNSETSFLLSATSCRYAFIYCCGCGRIHIAYVAGLSLFTFEISVATVSLDVSSFHLI